MATLEDLNKKSITDMTPDEAIDYLRQIRLSRRTPKASPKKSKKQVKKQTIQKTADKLSSQQAVELLELLGK